MNVSVIEIDSSAVRHNLSFFRSKLKKNTKLLVVVKAFSYGSDSIIISKILANENVDYLAVAYVQEGIEIRKAGVKLPILVLHPQLDNLHLLLEYDLEPNIYSNILLDAFILLLKAKKINQYAIHLKFNTGMNRLGFNPRETDKIITTIKNHQELKIASVFSHLASSENPLEKKFTESQIFSFLKIKTAFEQRLDYKPIFHITNTSGILNYPKAHLDMVRLGIGLYGFTNASITNNLLKNVLSLKSKISQIHTLEIGDSVGYNRAFKAITKTRIGIIPIGYADGLRRELGNSTTQILVNNQKAMIIGIVCMDIIMVDLAEIDCKVGDVVSIFNSQETILQLSEKMNTIPYEVLTMISQRIKRVVK